MTRESWIRRPIAVLALLWLAAFGADRVIRPAPGLDIAFYRAGDDEPAFQQIGPAPFDRSLSEVAEQLGPGFRARYRGWIRLSSGGVYHAVAGADRTATVRLKVAGRPLVGLNAGPEYPEQTYLELDTGLHRFELEYRHHAGGERPALSVVWSKGVAAALAISPDAVFGQAASPGRFAVSTALRAALGLLGVGLAAAAIALALSPASARALALRAGSLVAGSIAALVVAELALQVAGVARREYVPGTIWLTYDYPEPGTTTQYVGYFPYLVKEFEVPVTINSRGWRDREFSRAKADGVVRIVVVGDSYVEGKEVRLEETFHKLLEARLNEQLGAPDRRFEVIALARGGISTRMELRVIRERAALYHPDLVVLGFFPGNDVRENHPQLDREFNLWVQHVYTSRLTPARIRCTDALTLVPASLLNNLVTSRLCDIYVAHLYWFRDDLGAGDMVSLDADVYRETDDERWRAAWKTSEQLITQSRQAAEEAGASFLLMLIHSAQLAGASGASAAEGSSGALDLDRPFRILTEICARQRIDCLNLKPALDRFQAETGERYFWRSDAHWNAAGHRVAADALFDRVAPRFRDRSRRSGPAGEAQNPGK